MNATGAFLKIQLKNTFSFSTFVENFKGGKAAVRKNIVFIVGILYFVVLICLMFGFQQYTVYRTLQPEGMQSLVLINTAVVATLFPLLFGFLHAAGSYVTESEENLLSLPVQPAALFASKWLSSYMTQLPFAALITATGAGIYGYMEGILFSPLYIAGIIVGSVMLPLFPFCLIYVLLVFVLSFGKGIKRKRLLTGIGTVIMIFAVIGFNTYLQNSFSGIKGAAILSEVIRSDGFLTVTNIISHYAPITWFTLALSGNISSAAAVLNLLLLSVTGTAVTMSLVKLLAPAYRRSIIGFFETESVKMKASETGSFINRDIRSTPILQTLFKRDVLNVLREPGFFFGGPCVIIFLPAVFLVSFVLSLEKASGTDISSILGFLGSGSIEPGQIIYWVTGIASVAGMFLGSITGLGTTAFSREGKMLQNLKAMPIDVRTLVTAKMLHALLYAGIAAILMEAGAAVVTLSVGISFSPLPICGEFFLIAAVSISGSFLMQSLDMFIDTANPKFDWVVPAAVFKRNLNSGLGLFLSMGITALLVCAMIFLPHTLILYAALFVVITAADILIWNRYLRFAEKRYPAL